MTGNAPHSNGNGALASMSLWVHIHHHLENVGQRKAANTIKNYLKEKQLKDQGKEYNERRYKVLERQIAKELAISIDRVENIDIRFPDNSPWQYYAKESAIDGNVHAILDIHEYLQLKAKKDAGEDIDELHYDIIREHVARHNDISIDTIDYVDVDVPRNTQWALLKAHLALNGDYHQIIEINEYFGRKQERDKAKATGEDYPCEAQFQTLKSKVMDTYAIFADFQKYLPGGEAKSNDDASADLQKRIDDIIRYIDNVIAQDDGSDTLNEFAKDGIRRSQKSNARRAHQANDLLDRVNEENPAEELWPDDAVSKTIASKLPHLKRKPDTLRENTYTISADFKKFVKSSLSQTKQMLLGAINHGDALIDDQLHIDMPERPKEYLDGFKRIRHLLLNPDDIEDIDFKDLIYFIGQHRKASRYRGSTASMYEGIDALISLLVHSMPSEERYRESVNTIHNIVDPIFQHLSFSLKLSYLNVKHSLNLSSEEIEFYSTALGTLGTIMRGYGNELIDDRVKQYLHNTGDHGIRTVVTIVGVRDTVIRRFESLLNEGKITQDEYDAQVDLLEKSSKFRIKQAFLHDMGEYLGELLGNNLRDKSPAVESVLRRIRDIVENGISTGPALDEVRVRLHELRDAGYLEGWDSDKIERFAEEVGMILDQVSPDPETRDHYESRFDEKLFDVFERLNTSFDMSTMRAVGKIDDDGKLRNAQHIEEDDDRYTLQYVFSKICGETYKFKSTHPVTIAEYYQDERDREERREISRNSQETAAKTGTSRRFTPEDELVDIPFTDRTLLQFIEETDMEWEGSMFKDLYNKTIDNYYSAAKGDITIEEAKARQMHDEALLDEISEEMVHYAKKHAKQSPTLGEDAEAIERAIRSKIGQGIAVLKVKLREQGKKIGVNNEIDALAENGIELAYMKQADWIFGKKRKLVSAMVLGGYFTNPDEPHQVVAPLQPLFKAIHAAVNGNEVSLKAGASFIFRLINTFSQLIAYRENFRMTNDDTENLLGKTAVSEAVGDAGLTVSGGFHFAFDFKMLASINPFFTWRLKIAQDRAEAIEKCYGHILLNYTSEIAQKYGLDDDLAIHNLKKSSNKLGKYRQFFKKDSDKFPSGKLAEEMYECLAVRYDILRLENTLKDIQGKIDAHGIASEDATALSEQQTTIQQELEEIRRKKAEILNNKKFARIADESERYVLHAQLKSAIIKAETRLAQTTGSGKDNERTDQLASLHKAKDDIPLSNTVWFFRRHGMAFRFALIASLGIAFTFSNVGFLIALPVVGTQVNVLGLGLAAAGTTALLATIKDKFKTTSQINTLFRFLKDLPHFEFDKHGLHVIKGDNYRLNHDDNYGFKQRKLMRISKDYNTSAGVVGFVGGALSEIWDFALATATTPFRLIADYALSNKAFGAQNTTTTLDTAFVIAAAVTVANPTFWTVASAAAAYLAWSAFRRVYVQNMYKTTMIEAVQRGETPIHENIQQQVAKKMEEETVKPLFNLFVNMGKSLHNTQYGYLATKAFDIATGVEFNAQISTLGRKVHNALSATNSRTQGISAPTPS